MDKPDTNRRSFIQSSAALSLLALSGNMMQHAQANSPMDPKVAKHPLNLEKPEDNLHAMVKMLGDISGKTSYSWSQGEIYGVLPDKMADPMFKFQTARVGRYLKQADGSYLYRYRGMIFYQDFETGKFLDEYLNPYTGKTVAVKHWHSSIGEYALTVRGPKPKRTVEGEFPGIKDEPFILPWLRLGDRVWVTMDERVRYKRPSDGEWRVDNAIMRYESLWSELNNPELNSARTSTSWQTAIDWFTWLDMAGTPGRHMQGGAGAKLIGIDEFPKPFYDFAESRYPGVLTAPIK